jgi:putative protein kinase ArgK-like GTPase of G3E family
LCSGYVVANGKRRKFEEGRELCCFLEMVSKKSEIGDNLSQSFQSTIIEKASYMINKGDENGAQGEKAAILKGVTPHDEMPTIAGSPPRVLNMLPSTKNTTIGLSGPIRDMILVMNMSSSMHAFNNMECATT